MKPSSRRAMQITPGRRPLDLRWNSYLHRKHRQRLLSIKGLVDQSPPAPLRHLSQRMKQEQMKEDRYTEIERSNRILLERVTKILSMQRPIAAPVRKKSLHSGYRKRVMEKIAKENQSLLKRLQNTKSGYDVDSILTKQDSLLKNTSYFSIKDHSHDYETNHASPKLNLPPLAEAAPSKVEPASVKHEFTRKSQTPILDRSDAYYISSGDKVVVYKKGHEINGKNYVVEISKGASNPNQQNVIAYSLLGEETLYLTIPAQVYGDAQKYAEEIARGLRLRNGKLFLVPRWKAKSVMRGPVTRTITTAIGKSHWVKYPKAGSASSNISRLGYSYTPSLVNYATKITRNRTIIARCRLRE